MCACMYACLDLYTCMYVCMYVCVYVRMPGFIYVYVYVHDVCVRMYVCLDLYTYMYVCAHVCACVWIYMRICTCMYVLMSEFICVCVPALHTRETKRTYSTEREHILCSQRTHSIDKRTYLTPHQGACALACILEKMFYSRRTRSIVVNSKRTHSVVREHILCSQRTHSIVRERT